MGTSIANLLYCANSASGNIRDVMLRDTVHQSLVRIVVLDKGHREHSCEEGCEQIAIYLDLRPVCSVLGELE